MTTKEAEHWEKWNTAHRKDAINETTMQLGQTVLNEFNGFPLSDKPRILEVACGTGWLAHHFILRGDYIGLDLAPAAIEIARQRVAGARFECVDFHSWELEEKSVDAIVCVDAIACFHDQDLVVQKFARFLKPGGMVILTTVNPFVYSRIWWVKPPGEGQARKWLSKKALSDLLSRNGFRVLKSYTILPEGDRGVLRLVNGRKINAAANLIIPKRVLTGLKEKVGLGQFRIAVAQLQGR